MIRGRVRAPRARPPRPISVWELGVCARKRRVGTLRPRADGTFTANLPAPDGPAFYRLHTVVRLRDGGRVPVDTFSLPMPGGAARGV